MVLKHFKNAFLPNKWALSRFIDPPGTHVSSFGHSRMRNKKAIRSLAWFQFM